MIRGFRTVAGERVPFADIDVYADWRLFNCSPASLRTLLDSVKARDGVNFSASQLGTTTRQHVLRSMDYYPPTAQAMSGFMGTVKHAWINREAERLVVEQRYVSKRDPRISAQIDSAVIITPVDQFWVDLWDLKTTKWYATTLIAKDVWRHHPDYAWQLNLGAALMEEHGYRVRNLYLECIPADSSYKHEAEARKLGLPEHQKVIVQIDRKSAEDTYAVYFDAMKLRDDAIAAGYAPLCADRWSNRTIDNLRCRFFCDVKDECIDFSHDRGEAHPIAPLDRALEASIARARERNATGPALVRP